MTAVRSAVKKDHSILIAMIDVLPLNVVGQNINRDIFIPNG